MSLVKKIENLYLDKVNVNCSYPGKRLQGSADKIFNVTILDDKVEQIVGDTADVEVIVLYNPRLVSNQLVLDGSYVLNKNSDDFDVSISNGKISIPFHEEMVTYAGKNELILKIIDGFVSYTYKMTFEVERNDGYHSESIPNNLPSYTKLMQQIQQLQTEYAGLEAQVLKNEGDIVSKADSNLSNVGDFSSLPDGSVLIKKDGIIKDSEMTIDGDDIIGRKKMLQVKELKTSSQTVNIGDNISLSENGGFLEMMTNSLGAYYLMATYKNDAQTGSEVPKYWERGAKEQEIIQRDNTSNMVLTTVDFGHPNFDRQIQAIYFDFLTAVTNLRMEFVVNGKALFHYPSENAWDGLEPGLNVSGGIQKIDINPFFSNLTAYDVTINFRSTTPINVKGDGSVPWYQLDFNRMTEKDIALDENIIDEAPEDGILYGRKNGYWLEIPTNGSEAPPIQNEFLTIGAGKDYPTVQAFLNDQKHRDKNEFVVTGEIASGEIIDYPIEVFGGDLTNVVITSVDPQVVCTLVNTPFTFKDCTAPTIHLNIQADSIDANSYVFQYTNCIAPIGNIVFNSTGWGPKHIFYLEVTDAYLVSEHSEIKKCGETVFNVVGGKLLLNYMKVSYDCAFMVASNGARIDSMLPYSFNAIIEATVNITSHFITVNKGSFLSNVEVRNSGGDLNTTVLEAIGSYVNNFRIDCDQCRIGIEAYSSTLKDIEIECDSFTYSSAELHFSDLDVTMSSSSNTGGNFVAEGSSLRTNKATSIDYTKGSLVHIQSLDQDHQDKNSITENGILMVPTSTGKTGEQVVIAGYTYTPDIALNLEFVHMKLILNVNDVTNYLVNAYEIELLNRPSGVEITGLKDLGTPEHGFTNINGITSSIVDNKIRLSVATTGAGETLHINYDMVYSR